MDASWQINAGHRDYLRSSQDPGLDRPVEQLVEVAAYADRNMNEWKSRRGPAEEG